MIKFALVFASAFGLCAALGAAGAGCSDDEGDCPPCPEHPPFPSALAALPITYASVDDTAPLSADPTGGTMEVTGQKIIFRYEFEGVHHEVVYAVDP